MNNFKFNNQRVLVTGATGVLGRTVASAFAAAGAVVTGVDIAPDDDAPWRTLVADLVDPQGARNAVAVAGEIDILANIAGGIEMGDVLTDTSDETWNFMMDMNVRTMLNACRAAVPGMRARGGGRIVSIAARAAQRGAASIGAYAASKSVVIRMTETLSEELKRDGINVNCIMPSIIDTPRNRAEMPSARFDRWVSPQDVTNVVLFLSSPAAHAIHGAAIPVDGLS